MMFGYPLRPAARATSPLKGEAGSKPKNRDRNLAPPLGGSCRRSRLRGAALLCALLFSLTACAPSMEEISNTYLAMDTVMNLTIYHDDPESGVDRVYQDEVQGIYDLERLFSVVDEDSDIHNLNANCGQLVEIAPETAELLAEALTLCEETGGALDITAYPAVKAWGFTTGEYRVPGAAELTELAGRIDYTRVELEGETACISEGMMLDLGAVAKGYTADRLTGTFRDVGVEHALLDLGQSTIAAIGTKPDGKPWRIGIQDPAGTDYLGVLELNDRSMGSSGNYQRYFEENGKIYGHIIDPDTAAPADSGLAGVTVVADSAFLCDGLSTALFVMGLEDAADYWRGNRDFEAIFIGDSGDITITPGLKESFSLVEGYKDREVNVLE